MRTLSTLCLTLLAVPAFAQDDDRSGSKRRARDYEQEIIREVERGYYLKGGAGTTQYVGTFGGIVRPVMGLNIAIGQDFVDKERMSLAWELVFNQALHNGPKNDDEFEALPGLGALVQGDIHTFSGLALFEASTYVTRRLGLGVRAGGGVMMVPVLMYDDPTGVADGYTKDRVNEAWGGQQAAVHGGPLPMVSGGPTLEYYTKLSHFSVGIDVDVSYVINFDLGISPSGYLKYTF